MLLAICAAAVLIPLLHSTQIVDQRRLRMRYSRLDFEQTCFFMLYKHIVQIQKMTDDCVCPLQSLIVYIAALDLILGFAWWWKAMFDTDNK